MRRTAAPRALYHGGRGRLSRQLTRRPQTVGRCGSPAAAAGRGESVLAPALLVDHHAPVVDQRERIGDWEGDLIVGRMTRSPIATLVNRCSRLLQLGPPS